MGTIPIDQEDRVTFIDAWPSRWARHWDKREKGLHGATPNNQLPLDKRIRNLVKAGALIAAEIDRLQDIEGHPR